MSFDDRRSPERAAEPAGGARPDPLIVTFSDSRYLPLLQLWSQRLGRLGVDRIRVFCLDAPTHDWCQSHGVASEPIAWRGDFRDLWVQRIRVFRALLEAGEEFVHSDTDAIWIQNPLRCGSAVGRDEDLLFSQGTVWPPDVHDRWGFVLCCGWFRARPTPAARAFFDDLEADVHTTGDDQVSVNRLLAAMGTQWTLGPKGDYQLPFRQRMLQCWTRPVGGITSAGFLSVGLLPHREFQRLPEDTEFAVVKHYLTPKDCAQKLRALAEYGLV
jgi:hypothetical protein